MIDSAVLTPLLLDALSGKISWLEASTKHSLDEYIDTFYSTRAVMTKTIADLTDAQVAYQMDNNPLWSISETITHLIYSQNSYYNFLLDISENTTLPHILEAARGFGEGAKVAVPAESLRGMLAEATVQVREALEATRSRHDPSRITVNPLFGKCNYATWVLLMLGHESDHLRQTIIMRRAAKAAIKS